MTERQQNTTGKGINTVCVNGEVKHITELDIDDSKYEDTDFNDLTLTHFSVDFEQFAGVVDALLPLSPVVSSPMSGKKYHAFMSKDGLAFIKTEADV